MLSIPSWVASGSSSGPKMISTGNPSSSEPTVISSTIDPIRNSIGLSPARCSTLIRTVGRFAAVKVQANEQAAVDGNRDKATKPDAAIDHHRQGDTVRHGDSGDLGRCCIAEFDSHDHDHRHD